MIERELTDHLCMLKGFVSGSLFAISILSGYGLIPQLILFVLALFVFMENVFDLGKQAHVFTAIMLNIFGVILSLILWLYGMILPYTAFIILLMALLYGYTTLRKA